MRVPLMMDEKTDPELCKSPHASADAPPHIWLDCMAFGMGTSCLQMTFQASNLAEARLLYDQLSVLSPLMLALTAATPAYRGFLAGPTPSPPNEGASAVGPPPPAPPPVGGGDWIPQQGLTRRHCASIGTQRCVSDTCANGSR